MSKIALQANNSGTGIFTIASPNSDTNRTVTLPDEAGIVLTNASNIEAQVKTATNATGSAPVYACRAWVNFDGITGPTIRGSGNVSSVTRTSTGNYTINFTTAMPDANYAVQVTPRQDNVGFYNQGQVNSTSAGSCDVINSPDRTDNIGNSSIMCVSVFR